MEIGEVESRCASKNAVVSDRQALHDLLRRSRHITMLYTLLRAAESHHNREKKLRDTRHPLVREPDATCEKNGDHESTRVLDNHTKTLQYVNEIKHTKTSGNSSRVRQSEKHVLGIVCRFDRSKFADCFCEIESRGSGTVEMWMRGWPGFAISAHLGPSRS